MLPVSEKRLVSEKMLSVMVSPMKVVSPLGALTGSAKLWPRTALSLISSMVTPRSTSPPLSICASMPLAPL